MAEPLLGVILATSSSRGEHVVFRWPNNPKLFKRYSKVKYYTEARPSHLNRLEDDLDPVRQKAKWDRHDEDDDDHADGISDGAGQSDTPSSSDVEDSDGTMADDDENRSVRDRAETVASHGRSKTGASATASRSKSKARRALMGMEEASPSVRSGDRHNGAHKDAADGHDRAPESDAGTSKELSPEEKAKREERAARAYKTYLGYDIELLASILNPRQELTHHKFELMIDDLAFLGHPVSLDRSDVLGGQGDEDADAEEHDRSTGQRGRSGLRKEIRPYEVSDGGDASKETAGPSRQNGSKTEAAAPSRARNASQTRMEQTSDSSVSRSYAPLTQFHLVLVLDRPDPSTAMHGMDLSSWLQLFYDNIIFKMTSALFAEQRESDYIGRETEKLLALRERCMDDGQAYAAYAAQCLGISSLARCIRDLYKSISTSSDAFLTINDNIEVHLQLPPILQDPSNLLKTVDIETELDKNDPIFLSGGGFSGLGKEGADEDGGGGTHDRLLGLEPNQLSFEEWCRTTGPYLLPWKTLLLLHDHADPGRDRNTAGSSSPSGVLSPIGQAPETHGFEQLTRNFTALFRPNLYHTLNFSDVADMLGWELYEDIYPMVRHLIYYRQARVIDIPKPGHVYAISPLFDFARLGPLSHVWARSFPDVAPLPVLLSQLSSSSRAFSALFPARHQRELALDVLIWLLRREVVVKMHIRLRLIATESVKRRTAERRAERHERHRVRKEKKRQRAAKSEAKRMKKSQSEEQQRRKAAEQAARKEKDEDDRKSGSEEDRGRIRERDRSRSTDARKQSDPVEEASSEAAEAPPSGLADSRPPILVHPDSVAEAAAVAAAISGAGAGVEERRSGSHEHGRHHHHHHHHRHHHRHHPPTNEATAESDASKATSEKAPIAIAPRQQFDELKFERRPVLRSRSPSSAMMAAGTSTGLSVSFSNLSERGELGRRARADTTSSSSSGGGLAAGKKHDGISMTPNTSQQSRPTTPIVAGRTIPSHVRDGSVGASGSNISSSAEGSVPRHARRATSSASRGGRKGVARSRSPSRARMRVKGFGVGAEVEIDEDGDDEEDEVVPKKGSRDTSAEDRKDLTDELSAKVGSLRLTGEGKSAMKQRRISTASERPDLPPPSESADSDHPSQCSCSQHSSSSSDDLSTSDFSLSSDSSSSSSSSLRNGRRALQSPPSSSSVSAASPIHTRAPPSSASYTASLIIEPSRASRRENEYIATMLEHKDAATVKHFFRLLPYLNGKHTIDEIEYRVKMRRKEIRRLLQTFREFIVTFMHP